MEHFREVPESSNFENNYVKQKQQKNRSQRLLCEVLLDFSKNTTLHGPRYIAERGLSAVEKVFWIVTFVTSLCLCIFLIGKVWMKWQTSPVIVSLSERLVSVTEVPFPAVTLCPQAKIKQQTYNFTEQKIRIQIFAKEIEKLPINSQMEAMQKYLERNPSMRELRGIEMICDLYTFRQLPSPYVNYTVVQKIQKEFELKSFSKQLFHIMLVHLDIDKFDSPSCSEFRGFMPKRLNMDGTNDYVFGHYFERFNNSDFSGRIITKPPQNIAPQLHDMLEYGTWRSMYFEAKHKIFHPVLTQEGVCFTFNSLHVDEIFHKDRIQSKYAYSEAHRPRKGWSLEDGYTSSSHKTYPCRGRANGAEPDLVLYLREILDRDILCDGFNRGFKVYLHHPADLPQSSLYYYAVPPDQVASFAIKVNVMTTSDTLLNYPPHIRQCYFPEEKDLRYFKVYTPSNCRLECLTNYTQQRCGCVWFHMPHNGKVDLCSINKVNCVFHAQEDFYTEDGIKNSNASLCQCMPLCRSVQYEAEVLKTNYNANAFTKVINRAWEIINNGSQEGDNTKNKSLSNIKIEMFFKEPQYLSIQRSELFGLTDFLANCGGLLGLFLGFSFLSIVEIFYFFTLRLACVFRRDNIANKKDEAIQIEKF